MFPKCDYYWISGFAPYCVTGHSFKSWKKRFFVFETTSGTLSYFTDEDLAYQKGKAYIVNVTSSIHDDIDRDGRKYMFSLIDASSSTINFSADSLETKQFWMELFNEKIVGISIYQPDVVPFKFIQKIDLKIIYKNYVANDGNLLNPQLVEEQPAIVFKDRKLNTFYSLVMCDPDAHCVKDPKFREYIHLAAANIPGK